MRAPYVLSEDQYWPLKSASWSLKLCVEPFLFYTTSIGISSPSWPPHELALTYDCTIWRFKVRCRLQMQSKYPATVASQTWTYRQWLESLFCSFWFNLPSWCISPFFLIPCAIWMHKDWSWLFRQNTHRFSSLQWLSIIFWPMPLLFLIPMCTRFGYDCGTQANTTRIWRRRRSMHSTAWDLFT